MPWIKLSSGNFPYVAERRGVIFIERSLKQGPGRVTFADVTLERGATVDRDLFDWLQDVVVTSSGLGLTDPYYKRNLDIVQQDRDGTLRRWCLSRAWPTKFVAGEWDNEADENVIESVTLAYDFFELIHLAPEARTPLCGLQWIGRVVLPRQLRYARVVLVKHWHSEQRFH